MDLSLQQQQQQHGAMPGELFPDHHHGEHHLMQHQALAKGDYVTASSLRHFQQSQQQGQNSSPTSQQQLQASLGLGQIDQHGHPLPVLHHQQFHHVSMAQSAQAAAAAAAAAVAAATASGFPPQRGDQQQDPDQDQQGEQERHQDQQEQRQQDQNQPRQLRAGSPQQGGAMQAADPQQQAQQAQQALQKRKGQGDPAAGSALHACSAPTDMAGNPLRRTLWIRFKHGRPTEVELEEDELHIDHLKKRLKLLFPKMLGHVEVFEFSIRHSAADHGCVPEDFPLDHLREGNRAAAPLLVDAPEPTPNLASAALVAVAPPVCLDPAAGPGGVNLSYVVDGGRDDAFGAMGAVPGSLSGKGIGMGPGGMGGGGMHCDPDEMRGLFHPEAAAPPPAEVKVGGRKRKNAAGGGGGGAGGAGGGSQGMAHLGGNGLTEISPNSRSKKAADGLHKGQSIIMRYNNEDVAKARIVSCERSGFCKVRLHSLITDGSTLLYENSLPSGLRIPLSEVGSQEFLWPRADCRRDYYSYSEKADNSQASS
ncbi:hypothetical protein CLOM_g18642 [Closterium sp. NIES-68]|nr:hypothetical protein CLOM_g18642 [Closterium sp. NIES-68]GJP81812.1 hypothetical protein CLOP_g11937 [Closterium sp. NIES-67]